MQHWITALVGFIGVIVGALISAGLTRQGQKKNMRRLRLEELMTLCNEGYSSIPPGRAGNRSITNTMAMEVPNIDVHRISAICQLYARDFVQISSRVENAYPSYRSEFKQALNWLEEHRESSGGAGASTAINGGDFVQAITELRTRVFVEFLLQFGSDKESWLRVWARRQRILILNVWRRWTGHDIATLDKKIADGNVDDI